MKTKDISPLYDFMKFPVNLNRQIHESIHLLNLNYMYIWLLFAANKFRVQEPLDYNCTHWSRGSPQQQIKEMHKYSCIHAYYIPDCTDMCENYASIMTRIYIDPCLSQFIITFDQTGGVISLSIPPWYSRLQQNSQQT